MNLAAIDLNLLVVLGALLETGSVKGAATRLGLSPSATSHALGRLRDLLDDPVLVRAGQRMVPSAHAEQLRPRVERLLSDVIELLEAGDAVDPATLRRSFRISTTDYIDQLIIQPLGRSFADEAPGVDLYCSAQGNTQARLRNDQIDIAFGVFMRLADDIDRVPLMQDDFVCLLRPGHQRAKGRFTVAHYAALDHVLTSPGGGTRAIVDTLLERQGLARRVARTAPSFEHAAQMVVGTDFVLTVPRRIALVLAERLGLEVRKVPLKIDTFTISMAWHRRHAGDAAHHWLRDRVVELVTHRLA